MFERKIGTFIMQITKKKIFSWTSNLFPIQRSITGKGNRKTLLYIKKELGKLKIIEVKSGTKVFDWKIPNEWNIKDAYIKDEKNIKVVDYKKNNLHIVSYSLPVNKTISFSQLKKNLHFIKNKPNAIPYVTSYYKKRWGFCLSFNQFKKLNSKKYKVVIKSSLKNGSMSYGELYIKGKSKKEILISTNICHPSMANNETSGIVVTMALAKFLLQKKNYYSYRIIFIPETIGSINYISKNFDNLQKNLKAGFVLTCLGTKNNFSIIKNIKTNFAEKIILKVLNKNYKGYKSYSWLDRGSDERQFCSPRVNLPIVCISKGKFYEFNEYHTSLDNLNFISSEDLIDSFKMLKKCIYEIEDNIFYTNVYKCEPFLTKHNLYSSMNKFDKKDHIEKTKVLNILSYCNGENDLNDISKCTKLTYKYVKNNLKILLNKKLIKRD